MSDTEYTYIHPPPPSLSIHQRLAAKYLRMIPGSISISRDAAMLAAVAALHDLDALRTNENNSRIEAIRERYRDQCDTITQLSEQRSFWHQQFEAAQAQLNAQEKQDED